MITDFIAHILYHQYLTFAIDLREFNVPYRVRIGKIMSMKTYFSPFNPNTTIYSNNYIIKQLPSNSSIKLEGRY